MGEKIDSNNWQILELTDNDQHQYQNNTHEMTCFFKVPVNFLDSFSNQRKTRPKNNNMNGANKCSIYGN